MNYSLPLTPITMDHLIKAWFLVPVACHTLRSVHDTSHQATSNKRLSLLTSCGGAARLVITFIRLIDLQACLYPHTFEWPQSHSAVGLCFVICWRFGGGHECVYTWHVCVPYCCCVCVCALPVPVCVLPVRVCALPVPVCVLPVRVCVLAVHVCGIVLTFCLNSSGGLRFVRRLFIHHLSVLLFCGLVWVCLLCGREGRRRSSAYLVPVTQVVMHLNSGSSSSVCECLLQGMGFMSSVQWSVRRIASVIIL